MSPVFETSASGSLICSKAQQHHRFALISLEMCCIIQFLRANSKCLKKKKKNKYKHYADFFFQ